LTGWRGDIHRLVSL